MPPLTPEDCHVGLQVRVIGAPERHGTIAAVPRLQNEQYWVRVHFIDGITRNTPLEHLELMPAHLDAVTEIEAGRFESPESLRRCLLHQKLHGKLSDVFYSMATSDTEFLAYQFKPILKLLESPTRSLLVADEVGLGKTIEAGLIWTELQAREGAKTLLVVCPPHLVPKWRKELKHRFGVDARAVAADELAERFEETRRQQNNGFALIASYHGLRPPDDWQENSTRPAAQLARKLHLWGDSEEPFLDLLVMDEAAIMRNQDSQTSKLGGLLAPIAKHRVYLSATPLHTRSRNLFTLLRRLDPDTFPDEGTFEAILEANKPLVELRRAVLAQRASREELLAALSQAAQFPLLRGNRGLEDLRHRIATAPDLADPKVRSELAYASERVNLLSYAVTRTRRRDVDKKPVLREVNTVKIPLTALEREFYEAVTEAVYAYADQAEISAGFLTVMPQRQVASCLAAACDRLASAQPEEDETSPDLTLDHDISATGPLIGFLQQSLNGRFDTAALERCDTKYNCLLQALRDYWQKNPSQKIVLFAFFKPTLRYLHKRLQQDGIESSLLTGDETRDKQEVVDEFEKSRSCKILLSSEVGSEGLDLQFACALVNYDLPWNPMVVEQRIGRIHRIGQQAERILVINLVCEGTVDERIYDRLYRRLRLFEQTLGDLEAVVGPLINELTQDLLSHRLSKEQQVERIDHAAVQMQTQMQLEQDLEKQASVLAAYGDYIINSIAAAHERQDWINGSDLEAYALAFFQRDFSKTRIQPWDGQHGVFEIELDADAWYQFDAFIRLHKLHGLTGLCTREKRRVRFDHRVYSNNGDGTEVVHKAHPLIRFISHHLRTNRLVQPVAAAAEIPAHLRPAKASPGLYAFVSQIWRVSGLRDFEKIHHQVFSLLDQNPVVDPALATSIVEVAAALGIACDDKPQPGDELLERLATVAGDLQFEADQAFQTFLSQRTKENDDRKEIQLRGVDSFEHRRATAIHEARMAHLAAGRANLVAAMDGQLESLRRKCDEQRQRIQQKTTSGDSATIAAGYILIH